MFSLLLMRYAIRFPLFLWVANTGYAGSYLLLCCAQTQLLNMFASQNVHAYRCLTAYDVALQTSFVKHLIKPSGY